ncbi:hypothetical protein RGQ15_20360 [Paracoccus sp. MBLB3053]|uniref:Uncharacterized protein n=1 Tax=Paracoccus aurantius TaxID=3073814 RepID=A0ABU2HXY1_9RHOB|nr:hypothetical protein [Paracoccus sp. MBLB3053]MDS9469912.1 hypothetical protein [Paracoccus sp. MBLB3053]
MTRRPGRKRQVQPMIAGQPIGPRVAAILHNQKADQVGLQQQRGKASSIQCQ